MIHEVDAALQALIEREAHGTKDVEVVFDAPTKDWAGRRPCDRIASVCVEDEHFAAAHGACGSSAVYALAGYSRGQVIHVECNTNLMHPRTVLPTLHAQLQPGVTTLLCAVYADVCDLCPEHIPQEVLDHAYSL